MASDEQRGNEKGSFFNCLSFRSLSCSGSSCCATDEGEVLDSLGHDTSNKPIWFEMPDLVMRSPKTEDSTADAVASRMSFQGRGSLESHSSEEYDQLNKNVFRILDEDWPGLKNSSLLTTWRDRDKLMRSIGPEMRLVDPETIRLLGYIPRSSEGKSISMETAAERAEAAGKRFFIEMFSHRWHTPESPDTDLCNKANVLCEWARYRESMNFRTFFWIDYACINQDDIEPGIAMLPLYTSCCNNIVCYDADSYWSRAWTRVERLMFAAFVAPNNEVVDPDFKYNADAEKLPSGELKPAFDGKVFVSDPSESDADLSYKSDVEVIDRLRGLCSQHWAKCWKDGLMDIVIEKGGLRDVRSLAYGLTEIRLRRFV